MYLIKEIPESDRPRERLIKQGADALSNDELLAILFRTGMKDLSVIELSKRVLYTLESITDLKHISYQELLKIKGIKKAKATTLLAAIELGYRLSSYRKERMIRLQTAKDCYHLLQYEMSHLEQEHFVVLFLNVKGELLKKDTVYMGTINQLMIHPREIFKRALKYSASALILVHNHPSGNSEPSRADIKATEQLTQSAEIMGMDLIDHIIIGHQEFYSIKTEVKTKIK